MQQLFVADVTDDGGDTTKVVEPLTISVGEAPMTKDPPRARRIRSSTLNALITSLGFTGLGSTSCFMRVYMENELSAHLIMNYATVSPVEHACLTVLISL